MKCCERAWFKIMIALISASVAVNVSFERILAFAADAPAGLYGGGHVRV